MLGTLVGLLFLIRSTLGRQPAHRLVFVYQQCKKCTDHIQVIFNTHYPTTFSMSVFKGLLGGNDEKTAELPRVSSRNITGGNTAATASPPSYTELPPMEKFQFKLTDEEEEEDGNGLTEDEINLAREHLWRQNEYEFIETEPRSALFLGKSRSGKSTAAAVLKDPCYSPANCSIFSETVEARFQTFSIKDNTSGSGDSVKKYTINVIDTPGLFEQKAAEDEMAERTNDAIIQAISKCLENEITKINCAVIFVSVNSAVEENDVEAIRIFTELFRCEDGPDGVKKAPQKLRIALCITRADQKDKQWRKRVESELRNHKQLGPLIEAYDMKIIFMGCADMHAARRYKDSGELFQTYTSIYRMRKQLLDFIFQSRDAMPLLNMGVTSSKKRQVIESVRKLVDNFQFFAKTKDFQTQEAQRRLITHREYAEILTKNRGYFNVSDMFEHYDALSEAGKAFFQREDVPEDVAKKLSTNLRFNVTLQHKLTPTATPTTAETDGVPEKPKE